MTDESKKILPGSWLVLMGVWLFTLLIVAFPYFYDSDTYWHLANGREMYEAGRIFNEERFSYTHFGEAFTNRAWLAQIVFYVIWKLSGELGLFGFKLLISVAVVTVVFRTVRLVGAGLWLAAVLAIFAILSGQTRFVERPELFSILNLAVLGYLLYALRLRRISRRWIWFIPPLMVAWDFLHGAVYGFVFLALFAIGENLKPRLAILRHQVCMDGADLKYLNYGFLVTFALMLINPWGVLSYADLLGHLLTGKGQDVTSVKEYLPVNWKENTPYILLFAWAALLSGRYLVRMDTTQALLFFVFGITALRYGRMTAVGAVVLVPIIAALTVSALRYAKTDPEKQLLGAGSFLAALFIVAQLGVGKFLNRYPENVGEYYYPAARTAFGYHFNDAVYPVGALNFVKNHNVGGNIYNSGEYGGFLALYAAPERKIFQYNLRALFGDTGRYIYFPAELGKWDINYAIVEKGEILGNLFPEAGWARVYSDPFSALYLRRNATNQALITRYEIRHFFPGYSDDKLRAMSSDPVVARRMTFEMGVYLAYRRDDRMAVLWSELLANQTELRRQPDIQQLLQDALRMNRSEILSKWLA